MNWIDFIIIALLGFGLIRGFMDGLIIEVAQLAALVLGIWGAIHFSGWTAGKLAGWFDIQTAWLGIFAFAITFIIIVIGINLLGRLLDKLLRARIRTDGILAHQAAALGCYPSRQVAISRGIHPM